METEIEYGEQTLTVTYDIWGSEPQTLEYPGVEAGIEVECVENSRGRALDLKEDEYEHIGELVIRQLEGFADDTKIDNYEDGKGRDL
tara:strand:- start:970 stop:1230 length:261 start_codon:yes stop_codon:yes gene_type:complete